MILPLYDKIARAVAAADDRSAGISTWIWRWRHEYCGLFSLERQGVTWYFVDNENYFRRGRLYGEFDDGERFAFFCRAVHRPAAPASTGCRDVLHCNDWQTALVPVYLQDVATRWPEVCGASARCSPSTTSSTRGDYGADSGG